MKYPGTLGLFLAFLWGFSWSGENTLKLATTTSTYETGLLGVIFAPFEKKQKLQMHILAVGTGRALKLGENGDVDVILVHARTAEDKFVAKGHGVNRRDVMYNDFVVLGPEADPAGVRAAKKAEEALKKISAAQSTFVSRGDDSGTHKKEKSLWKSAGLAPAGKWYLESGQGMSATLRMADEKNAYVLADRAMWFFHKERTRLKLLLQGDRALLNPYGIIAVSPYKYSHVRYDKAMALISWMTSPECQKMIEAYRKNGNQLFYPNAARPVK
ncbi:substrate-binding domain-containing protein [Fibrobacterota bacterium]